MSNKTLWSGGETMNRREILQGMGAAMYGVRERG